MCWAIPAKVMKIEGKKARVRLENVEKDISIELMEKVKKGDYVLVHAGFAIERVDKKKAEFTIKFFRGEA